MNKSEIKALFNASKGDNDHHHHGATLEEVAPSLSVFYRAISNRTVSIIPYKNENDPVQFPDTHTTIRLPRKIDKYHSYADNQGWYKVALAHRAHHYEPGGLFSFRYDAPSACFDRLRPARSKLNDDGLKTELELFLNLFSRMKLAIEIFMAIEGLRTDISVAKKYMGLSSMLRKVQASALKKINISYENPANGLLHYLTALTLDELKSHETPEQVVDVARTIGSIIEVFKNGDNTVEDSAEATIRIYILVSKSPNYLLSSSRFVPVDSVGNVITDFSDIKLPELQAGRLEGDNIQELHTPVVEYRDFLGSRFTNYKGAGPLDQEAVFRFTELEEGEEAEEPDIVTENYDLLTQPDIPEEPMDHCPHDHLGGDDPEEHIEGELHDHEAASYVYQEWDCFAGKYKKNWCRVRESKLESSASSIYLQETLNEYRSLLPNIHRGLQRVAYEGLKKVHRKVDGEEIDLEAAIEAFVDIKMGLTPSDGVYISKERGERDVSVIFAVDKSSSTAEHIVESLPVKIHGKNYKTLLDIEKESIALLINSLEKIGDRYGVYFFSGSGREDVKFQALKEFDEAVGDLVTGRFDKIMPLHTTRMGPVIRHSIAKLRSEPSKTKILFLISDGRPFDIDYGQEYGDEGEAEYAINDTRRAMDEARSHNIKSFILTVDRNGEDYLGSMCEDLSYEVLDDVKLLPEKVLSLYTSVSS